MEENSSWGRVVSKSILADKRVQECSLAEDSDYKYEVFLKEGFIWGIGRNSGFRTMRFHTVAEFKSDAKCINQTRKHK